MRIAVSIDGNHNGRILHITGSGTEVALADLTLTNALAPLGENGRAVRFCTWAAREGG